MKKGDREERLTWIEDHIRVVLASYRERNHVQLPVLLDGDRESEGKKQKENERQQHETLRSTIGAFLFPSRHIQHIKRM